MVKKVLIVDDEPAIVAVLKYNLLQAGFGVITADDGEVGIKKVVEENPDIMILDLMLPKINGIEVCKKLRENKIMIPILILTAKDDEFEKILGLELGADDYMTKPFSPREVVARVKAILRRNLLVNNEEIREIANEDKIIVGDFKIFPERFEVYIREERLVLTPKEFELLVYLALHKNLVLSRGRLLNEVWNLEYASDTRIVDIHISNLREKIERNTKNPVYIKTIRGVGYKFEELK